MIVGLGNPGKDYRYTRHNIGFNALDRFAEKEKMRFKKCWRFPARTGRIFKWGQDLLLVKPQTFMNRSGYAVGLFMDKEALSTSDVIVIVDDADLPCGKIRVREQGSAGGHNGLKSIIQAVGTDAFVRVRMGVGPRPSGEALVNYVLSNFLKDEEEMVNRALDQVIDVLEIIVKEGPEQAMSRFN